MERKTLTDKVFYSAISGFTAGVFMRSFADFGVAFSLWFVAFGVAVFLLSFFFNHAHSFSSAQEKKKNLAAVLCAAFLFSAGLGMLRYDVSERSASRQALQPFLEHSVAFEGVVSDEPDEREAVTRLTVATEVATLLVTAGREPRFSYGDRVRVEGVLRRPENFIDETTLREVDYAEYLAKDGIYYELFKPKIERLSRGEGNPVVAALFRFKRSFIENVNRLIPQPHAALLAGLVMGAKQSLGKKLLDDFRTVGVIHIVVLSGYNITIVARFIDWLFAALARGKRLACAAAAVILFAVMVGASATVVRATIMALLALLARGTGRMYAVTRALCVAGAVMLLHNPKILVFDTSFQLSFLATVGLIYFSPLLEKRVKWITPVWNLREIVVATVATQLFVLPFLLYKTGTLSLVSLPVNLLILAVIPATMLFGFFTGLAGFVWSALAAPFAFISYAFLSYELALVHWFAALPFAALTVSHFPLWLVILWYAAYAILLFLLRNRKLAIIPAEAVL